MGLAGSIHRSVIISPLHKHHLDENHRRPNIVIVHTDDLGHGDLGCFGADDVAPVHDLWHNDTDIWHNGHHLSD